VRTDLTLTPIESSRKFCFTEQKSSSEALRELFELAEKELHVPQLLDVALVDITSDWPPDERSILTYLAMYLDLDKVSQVVVN